MVDQTEPSERRLLADSARSFYARHHSDARALALRESNGFEADGWRRMAEAGWLGARIPEESGGLGLGVGDCAAIVAEAGRAGASDPLISGCFVPSAALAGTACPAGQQALAALAENAEPFALADLEKPIALHGSSVSVEVFGAGSEALVPVALGGEISLRLLRVPDTCAVALADGTPSRVIDVPQAALVDAPVLRLGEDVSVAWTAALREGAALCAVQLTTCAAALLDPTVEHCRQRVQFGQPIAEFQVLRHRIVDMHIALQLSRTASDHAIALLEGEHEGAPLAVHVAKARCSDSAVAIARSAIQLHGAIGFTEESRTAPLVRQAMSLSLLFGSAARHRAAASRLMQQRRPLA